MHYPGEFHLLNCRSFRPKSPTVWTRRVLRFIAYQRDEGVEVQGASAVGLIVALAVGLAGCASQTSSEGDASSVPTSNSVTPVETLPAPSATPISTPAVAGRRGPYSVIRVADGDTLTVRIGANLEKVRVVGIDTPESVDPRRPVQCFGREASDAAKSLLNGKSVWLERDTTQGERDKYQRLLAFVWLDATTDFGLKMIKDGYALEYTYKLPYRYQNEYRNAQRDAKAQGAGLWSTQTCAGDTKRAA